MRLSIARTFLTDLSSAWGAYRPSRLAAALAYYGVFSIAPMLYVALTVAGLFVKELGLADRLASQLSANLSPEMVEFLQDIIAIAAEGTSGSSSLASLVGLLALLYAATGLFAQLQYALDTIWEVPPSANAGMIALIKNRLLAFTMVLGLAFLLIVAGFASVIISLFGSWFDWAGYVPLANHTVFVALLTVSFALIYKVLPNTKVAWRDVWLGAAVTALLFAVGRWALGLYLRLSNITSAFAAAGALAIMLVAIYYLAQIFLFGVVFTKVYAFYFGSRREDRPTPEEA